MEAQKSNFKFWLGLFIVVGLALFAGGIFIIGKQKNMFNPVFHLSSRFYNVSGLQVGNKVRFAGINVGTVDRISIVNDSTVVVDFLIRKEIQKFLKKDCETSIGSEGIIGDRVLSISQSESKNAKVVSDGDRLSSIEPIETDAIMASVQLSVDNVARITKDFSEISHNINKGNGTFSRLIRDPSLAKDLGQTMTNLKRSSRGLNENMEAAKENFLLRGYYKRKARRTLRKAEEAREKKKDAASVRKKKK
jgi:phospholipid/cholesterol/gamma-HCH transport system substrate-binding protein